MKKNANLEGNYYTPLATIILMLMVITLGSCSKERSGINNDHYTSTLDFHMKNEVAIQHYSIDATSGGSFTTLNGTKVTIPASSFTNNSGDIVSGNVDIEFKDIYKKSEMLLSDVPTTTYGRPLKSGGEFFIHATSGNDLLLIAPGKKIEIDQPFNNIPADTMMIPFIGAQDSAAVNWNAADSIPFATVTPTLSSYLFSLYQFSFPLSAGTWCNSDNNTYFQDYPLTTLTLNATDDPNLFDTDVFLVFKSINCMIHVYRDDLNKFPYNYAPKGLECTLVALGIKDGKTYSAFVPITIGDNQTISFTLNETTTDDFKAQLAELD